MLLTFCFWPDGIPSGSPPRLHYHQCAPIFILLYPTDSVDEGYQRVSRLSGVQIDEVFYLNPETLDQSSTSVLPDAQSLINKHIMIAQYFRRCNIRYRIYHQITEIVGTADEIFIERDRQSSCPMPVFRCTIVDCLAAKSLISRAEPFPIIVVLLTDAPTLKPHG